MKKILALLIVLSFGFGCAHPARFTYPLDMNIKQLKNIPPDVKIAVLPTVDERPLNNINYSDREMYKVPFKLYGSMEYNKPETETKFLSINKYDCNISDDIARAIAYHFQKAGVAKTVVFDNGGLADITDYTLHSTIKSSTYKGKIYSYYLSYLGKCFWIFGFPAGQSQINLELELVLVDRDGNKVWNVFIKDDLKIPQGLYYHWGKDMDGLSQSLQESLDSVIKNHPIPIIK